MHKKNEGKICKRGRKKEQKGTPKKDKTNEIELHRNLNQVKVVNLKESLKDVRKEKDVGKENRCKKRNQMLGR